MIRVITGSLIRKNREMGFPYSFFGNFFEGNSSRGQAGFSAAELPLLAAQWNCAREEKLRTRRGETAYVKSVIVGV
jgi:hypothetical protein